MKFKRKTRDFHTRLERAATCTTWLKKQVLCLFTLLKMICHSVLGTDISHFRKKNICGSVQSKRQNDGLLIRLQTNDAFI